MAAASSPPLFSPSSDKRFWIDLRSKLDCDVPCNTIAQTTGDERSVQAMNLKSESLILLRGIESIAFSLSHLSSNLDNSLQVARDLSKPPTYTETLHNISNGSRYQSDHKVNESDNTEETEEQMKGIKRKFEQQGHEDCSGEEKMHNQVNEKLNKAKNVAASMASEAAWVWRKLKSVKSDLCFMRERCWLLEEENRRLQEGVSRGIRPEEDDLVSLQLEALLGEKSRLAHENENLTRENRCLEQLVEYHRLMSQDLSDSYEQQALDFSSPSPNLKSVQSLKRSN